jgi:hypothetical protein
MKKIFTLIILLLPISLLAQWSLGINVSTSFSNYKTKTPWEEGSNIGYAFGIKGYNQFNSNFGFNIELQYIQKGYNHQICDTYYDKLKTDYIEIPMSIDYGFIVPAIQNLKIHGSLGFYSAYWLSGEYETKIDGEAFTETFEFEKNDASRFDFGPCAGARIAYLFKNGSLSLDYRYEMGLVDLQKKASDNTNNVNRATILGISYLKILGR